MRGLEVLNQMDLPKDKSNYISLCPNNYSHPTQPLTNEGGREPSSIWLECPAYLFLPRPVNKSKKACCIYERAGFRCYTANSRLSHQAETCFMLSPEVWPGKLLSQASLPRSGEKKKNKKASLAPVATSWVGEQPQRNLAPVLGSLEPWLPSGPSLPQSLLL